MKHSICLLLALLFGFSSVVAQQTKSNEIVYIIQGNLLFKEEAKFDLPTVQLMEITMSDQPSIKPVASAKPDDKGAYRIRFQPDSDLAKVFYRVSVVVAGQALGSDPFRLDKKQPTRIIDIEIPSIKVGAIHLEIPKEVVIIESMEEKVRLTTILFVVNRSSVLIDARNSPINKSIPKAASNVRLLGSNKDMSINVLPGEVEIGLMVPEGTRQVFFSYEMDVTGRSLEMDYDIDPGLKELELTTPERLIGIGVGEMTSAEYRMVEEQKNMGGRLFFSKIISLQAPVNSIPIEVNGIPIKQTRLIYPAVILMAVLLGGLLFYLSKQKRA